MELLFFWILFLDDICAVFPKCVAVASCKRWQTILHTCFLYHVGVHERSNLAPQMKHLQNLLFLGKQRDSLDLFKSKVKWFVPSPYKQHLDGDWAQRLFVTCKRTSHIFNCLLSQVLPAWGLLLVQDTLFVACHNPKRRKSCQRELEVKRKQVA